MSEEKNGGIVMEGSPSEEGMDQSEEQVTPEEITGELWSSSEEAGEASRGWQTAAIVGVSLVLLCCAVFACLAAAIAVFDDDEARPGEPAGAYIGINEPHAGDTLDISKPLTVVGRGAGLPEGNVVVQALDSYGTVLAQKATTIQTENAGTGGEGPWKARLKVKVESGTKGSIRAYAPSPLDNSTIAEDTAKVTFAAATVAEAYIEIREPAANATLEVGRPVRVNGMAGALPEGNVIVRATDKDGNVLVQEATTVQSPAAGTGGAGPWELELAIPADAGGHGLLTAFAASPKDGSVMASDEVKVTYASAEPEGSEVPLEGPGWLLISLDGRPVVEGTQITAEFKDGQVAGSAGCNNYSASYEVSGPELRIGPPGATRLFCAEPPSAMEQESAYLGLPEETAAYRVARGRLELEDRDGASILIYEAAVTGRVTYRQRIALPEDAVVKVQVADVSLADAPAKVIGEQIITNPGQVPVPYQVTYDAEAIDPRFEYAVQVRIEDGEGRLLFINTTSHPVITRGNPSLDVEVVVEPVG